MDSSIYRQWLLQNRAGVGPIDIGDKGVTARAAIRENDVLAAVPIDLIITEDLARKSPAAKPLVDAGVNQSEAIFAAFLLREQRRAGSFWAPYIAQMPTAFMEMPHYHGARLVPMLAGTRALQVISNNVQWAQAAHLVLQRNVPAFKDLPLDEYLWGYFAVAWRLCTGYVQDQKMAMLAPLVDGFGCALEGNAVWHCDIESGDCTVSALRDIAVGEAVCVSYGGKSNTGLFTRYGFTLAGNPVKECIVPVSGAGDEAKTVRVRNEFDEVDAPRLLRALRHGESGLDAERQVIERLHAAVSAQRRAIAAEPATPSADLAPLMESVSRVCADERDALGWWIEFAETMRPVLAKSGSTRHDALAHLARVSRSYGVYARALLSA